MNELEYWEECISQAADECSLAMTAEQLKALAKAAQDGHESYGMAFYSPSDSDRYSDLEREWKAKLKAKDQEMERYRSNAEMAVKLALRQCRDANVSIGENGEVTRWDGRATQIQ